MYHITLLLAAILIGTAFGAVLGPRNNFLFVSSLVAIALGVATLITASWIFLAIGTAVLLVSQSMQRDTNPSRA